MERGRKDMEKQESKMSDYMSMEIKIIESEDENRDLFIHFPDREEVLESLSKANLELIEDFYRADLFDENQEVKDFSTECRFWVVKR